MVKGLTGLAVIVVGFHASALLFGQASPGETEETRAAGLDNGPRGSHPRSRSAFT